MTPRKTGAPTHPDPMEGLTLEEEDRYSQSHDESNWLVSYADMMTLLCGFFILLFSMSKIDESKYEQLKEQLAKDFDVEYVSSPKDLAKSFSQKIQELGVEKSTSVRADALGVAITFESAAFFETLSAEVSPKGKDILNQVISSVIKSQKEKSKTYQIIIEGHTDSRPVLGGIYPSNWELSGARAARVVRLFLDHGFKTEHLIAIGYADTYPVAESKTPDGKWDDLGLAKNRRVVVRILEPGVDAIPFPDDGKSKEEESQAEPTTTALSAPLEAKTAH
jgi:chemotaxis protein MotB